MKKRLISVILAVCIAIGLLPMGAAAAEETEERYLDPNFYSAQIFDEEHAITEYGYYAYAETERVIWCMTEGGFTLDETQRLRVVLRSYNSDSQCVGEDTLSMEFVRKDGDLERYDVKIDLSGVVVTGWDVLGYKTIELLMSFDDGELCCAILFLNLSEAIVLGDYQIGFIYNVTQETVMFNGGVSKYYYGINTEGQLWEISPRVGAVQEEKDEQGGTYYVENTQVNITINRAWIETVSGEQEALSFSTEEYVGELESPLGTQFTCYLDKSKGAVSLVWVEVEAQLEGETKTGRICCLVGTDFDTAETIKIERDSDDTVEKLNKDLQDWSEQEKDVSNDRFYEVQLPAITYTGTIEIPDGFSVTMYGSEGEGTGTIIQGGIKIGTAGLAEVYGIHFRAQGDNDESALYGGNSCSNNCSFVGYDIAIKSEKTYRAAAFYGNVFINNGIALQIDGDAEARGVTGSIWDSTFINNGTAIQIKNSGQPFNSTYYYRITNCNFINNNIDIETNETGTFYFHKNYFGVGLGTALDLEKLAGAKTVTAVNNLVLFRGAQIEAGSDTKVITNPQWAFPVTKWWQFNIPINTAVGNASTAAAYRTTAAESTEEEYVNYLICDWEKPTQISNEEAGDLILDPSAFEEVGKKEIVVVDQYETVLGTWSFDGGGAE